jgi:hypothetical protein
VAVAVLALATGCTSDGEDPTDQPEPAPAPTQPTAADPPPRPELGACHRLSYEEAVAPTDRDRVVECARPHTSQTYSVGRLETESDGHLLAVDSKAVQTQVAARCPAHLAGFLGATDEQLRLSLMRGVWFTPSLKQSDKGASWYRCDVIAVAGTEELAEVTTTFEDALATEAGRTAYGMCGTTEPGTEGFEPVLCGEPHAWRAIDSVELEDLAEGKGRYPGEEAVREAGQGPCDDAAREIAADALDYEWGYEWPTEEQWDAGQTWGRCWAPDPA